METSVVYLEGGTGEVRAETRVKDGEKERRDGFGVL